MLKGIIAVDKNFAIGRSGTIPWHLPEELQFFRSQTEGHTIVMGRTTFESFGGRTLPNRLHLVLSRSQRYDSRGNLVGFASVEDALAFTRWLQGDVFVIGGAEIYRAFAPQIDEWIVTHVPFAVDEADTFMPQDFLDGFSAVRRHVINEDDELVATYYRRDP